MGTISKATKQLRLQRAFLREALTLGSPRGRLFVFVPVLIALALLPVAWLARALPQFSICNRVLGEYCYSVGITRGVSSILHADFAGAWQYNPLSYLVLAVMAAVVLSDVLRIRRAA
jgi:hypothetical protein